LAVKDEYAVDEESRFGPDVEDLDRLGLRGPDGRPVTEEATERFTRDRGGRPSLGQHHAGAGASPRIAFRVPAETFEHARDAAKREGTDVSKIARKALEEYLDRI
jgi:hypothetical protein